MGHKMKFLLTNDDGIDAPGLATLEQALTPLGDCVVVAPAVAHSGCSHQVTSHDLLKITTTGIGRYAIDGTPADCVRLGILHVVPDADWVIAGVNDGGNLGVDVYMSGTVAAAREATLLGKPALAFSQYRRQQQVCDWSASMLMVRRVFEDLQDRPLTPHVLWNVNFPDPANEPPIVHCQLDPSHLPVRYEDEGGTFRYQRGNYHQRDRIPGADVDVCFSGGIAVSEVYPPWPI